MRLDQNAIAEFKKIYTAEFGEPISDDEAQEIGARILQLFQHIYKPLPHDHYCSSCSRDYLED
jgi:hypothetical protein